MPIEIRIRSERPSLGQTMQLLRWIRAIQKKVVFGIPTFEVDVHRTWCWNKEGVRMITYFTAYAAPKKGYQSGLI